MKFKRILVISLLIILIESSQYHYKHRLTHNKKQHKKHKDDHSSSSSSSSSSSVSYSSSVSSFSSSSSFTSSSQSKEQTQKGNWKDHLKTKLEEYDCSAVQKDGDDDDDFISSSTTKSRFEVHSLGAVEGEGHRQKNNKKTIISKRKEMLETRFSQGQAAYILDILDDFFLGSFIEDCEKIFEDFEKQKAPQDQVDLLPPIPNDKQKYVNIIQFDMGCKANKWDLNKKLENVFNEYDVQDKNGLNFKEIIYSSIIINHKPGNQCNQCFEKLKIELDEFFDFIDCNKDNQISAEDIQKAFQNLKLDNQPSTAHINGFVLKIMDKNTATIHKNKFATFMLLAMFERVVQDHGIDEESLNIMKKLRAGKKGGCGKEKTKRKRRFLF